MSISSDTPHQEPNTAARLKQIEFGKITPEWVNFLRPCFKRHHQDQRYLPPDPNQRGISKRGFDALLKEWRRNLHDFDDKALREFYGNDLYRDSIGPEYEKALSKAIEKVQSFVLREKECEYSIIPANCNALQKYSQELKLFKNALLMTPDTVTKTKHLELDALVAERLCDWHTPGL